MPALLWDASALAKRYLPELGTATVDALFNLVEPTGLLTTSIGYTETFAVLLRRRNAGDLDQASFAAATQALHNDVLYLARLGILPITDPTIISSTPLILRHNLNATDAAILTLLLDHDRALQAGSQRCALIACDQRLLRAARAEGLVAFNPEEQLVDSVEPFLASLP
jgi:predicted nucleic acid-binding protein